MSLEPIDIKFVVKGNVDKEIDKIKRSVNGIDTTTKQAAGKANQNLSGIGKQGGKIGKQFSAGFAKYLNPTTLGISTISGALIKIGKDAYNFSKEFDSAMREVKTISSLTGEAFDDMSDSILKLSTMPIKDDAQGLSKAMYQIVSAGYDGAEGLAVLEASAKAATGGVTTTMTAADGFTTVMNAWGASVSEVDSISDKMFTTVRLGKTTMEELSSNIAKVAPLASSLGVSFDEVFAATASITKQGTPTAEAFTQMRAALTAMNNVLGDGWAETMTFQEGLAKVRDMAGGSQQELKRLLGTDEAVLATLALTGEKAAGAAADLEAMGSSAGAASAAFEEMSKDVDIKWDQVSKKWKAMLDGTGDTLVQASSALADFLNAALTSVDGLGDEFDEIGESVNGFSERMKVLRNEGVGLFGSVVNALVMKDDDVQAVVDAEKAEVQATKDEIAALQEEYKRMEDAGASDEQLAVFKNNLQERYKAILEATEKEVEAQKKRASKSKILGVATLGLSSMVTDTQRARLKDKQDQADSYKQLFDAVAGLGVEAEKQVDKTIDSTTDNINEKTKGVIETLEEELKDLQDKTGTFINPEQEADNLQAIREKTEELEEAWRKVREEVEKSTNMDGKNPEMKSREVASVTAIDPKPISDSLAPMKKMTAEEEKQLKATKEKLDAEREIEMKREVQRENMEELADNLMIQVNAFDALSQIAGSFNAELGESVKSMSDMMYSSASLITNLSTGNWLGAVGSGVELITQMINSSRDNERDMQQAQIERTNRLIETQNKLMQMQTGDDWWKSATQELDRLNAIIKEQKDALNTLAFWQFTDLNLLNSPQNTQEWLDYIDNHNGTVRDNSGADRTDEVLDYVNQWTDAAEAVRELEAELWDEAFGFSSDDITSGIVDGIMSGFELAGDELGDFADSFQQLMEKAAANALTKTFNQNYLSDLMDEFEEAMKSDGKIDSDEMEALQKDYAAAVREMQDKAEAWAHVIGEQAEEAEEGLQGDIKGITQEQAGMLEGRMNAMHMKMIDLGDIQAKQLTALYAIESNTGELLPIVDDIEQLRQLQSRNNELLKKIADNSDNGGGFSI